MKIIQQTVLGTAHVLHMNEVPLPTLQAGEVLIKGAYTSINFADIKKRTGLKGNPVFPFTLGLDIAGVVEESQSTMFEKGDRVIAFPKGGTYAEFAVADESLTYKIPPALHLEQAAAMPTVSFLAAILVEFVAQVQATDTVVIHSAAGGVGSMLVQLCRLKGCANIIATVSSMEKAPYVQQLGADVVCTYETFVATTLRETNNEGATVIFDSVAGAITAQSLQCLAPFGTLVQFGNSSGRSGQFTTADVHNSCRSVKGFSLGTTRSVKPDFIRPYAEQMLALFAAGALQLHIDRVFPLHDAVAAHQYFEQRGHNGKVLLQLT